MSLGEYVDETMALFDLVDPVSTFQKSRYVRFPTHNKHFSFRSPKYPRYFDLEDLERSFVDDPNCGKRVYVEFDHAYARILRKMICCVVELKYKFRCSPFELVDNPRKAHCNEWDHRHIKKNHESFLLTPFDRIDVGIGYQRYQSRYALTRFSLLYFTFDVEDGP